MDKSVTVVLKSRQSNGDETQDMEVMTDGEFYVRGEKKYLIFEEILEESMPPVKTMLKLLPEKAVLTRKGPVEYQMEFECGKKNITYYNTPMGNLVLEIDTEEIDVVQEEHSLQVNIHYLLEMDGEPLSCSSIEICVKEKK